MIHTQDIQCRNCMCGSEKNQDFIRPCLCTGSLKWVHRQCLDRWRVASMNNESFFKCDECGHYYSFVNNTQSEISWFPYARATFNCILDISMISVLCAFIIIMTSFTIYLVDHRNKYIPALVPYIPPEFTYMMSGCLIYLTVSGFITSISMLFTVSVLLLRRYHTHEDLSYGYRSYHYHRSIMWNEFYYYIFISDICGLIHKSPQSDSSIDHEDPISVFVAIMISTCVLLMFVGIFSFVLLVVLFSIYRIHYHFKHMKHKHMLKKFKIHYSQNSDT
jgi:hypothetical protein